MSADKHINLRVHIHGAGVFTVVIFVCAVIESSFLSQLKPLGVTPDILLAVVLGAGLFMGEKYGALCGIAAGFVADAFGSVGISFLPLVFFAVGFLCGLLRGVFLSDKFISWLAWLAIAVFIRVALTAAQTALTAHSFDIEILIRDTLIPEYISTYLFGLPMYFLMRGSAMLAIGKEERARRLL